MFLYFRTSSTTVFYSLKRSSEKQLSYKVKVTWFCVSQELGKVWLCVTDGTDSGRWWRWREKTQLRNNKSMMMFLFNQVIFFLYCFYLFMTFVCHVSTWYKEDGFKSLKRCLICCAVHYIRKQCVFSLLFNKDSSCATHRPLTIFIISFY